MAVESKVMADVMHNDRSVSAGFVHNVGLVFGFVQVKSLQLRLLENSFNTALSYKKKKARRKLFAGQHLIRRENIKVLF